MTDDTENTISSNTPGTDGETAPPLVAFADCELITINSEMVLVINRQNGNQQFLSSQVADGLKSCSVFKTIEDHAADLAANRPELQGQEAMAIDALTSLMESGILMRSRDVCSRLAKEPAPHELPPTRGFCHHL